jgi:peptidoglycan/LPS O-acetylase OafA/YrhL
MADAPSEDLVIYHPNREKGGSKATKAGTILLLVASAVVVAIVTIGGWSDLEGAQVISIFFILVFALMAFFVARWNRGVLPLAAAFAIVLLVFAAIAAPGWFDRDAAGYHNPGLAPGLLGLLVVILIPLEFLLIVFSMRGFSQKWNVEIEMSRDEYNRRRRNGNGRGGYQYAQSSG